MEDISKSSKIVDRHIPCPFCSSSDAFCTYDDGHGFCFSCETYKPSEGKENLSDFTYEYMPWRGISRDTFRFYQSFTKIDSEGRPISIGFKYSNEAIKVRDIGDKKFFWQNGSGLGLFGRNLFAAGSHKYVTITEGELDALSLYQVLRSPVVSVQSAGSARRDCTVDRDWINSFERIYLAFDSDAAGRAGADQVAALFDYNKVYDVKFSNRKDANEYLVANEEDVLRQIWWNAKKYLPAHIKSSLADFKEILEGDNKWGVPYPWPTLNSMTYGIHFGESILITAQEGVGKTEIMRAIEHKILKETEYGVGAIFIEESPRRHLQGLAGLELGRPCHLPGSHQDETTTAVEGLLKRDDRLFVYTHFGSDDPDVLLDTIRFLVSGRGCRVVMLDHISMVVSGLSGEDERKALDYIATRLQMMVKELDFALIVVSHVNDEGQTRGSRYIGKIANVRIDVNRDLLSDDEQVKNTSDLRISKNRVAGQTGRAGQLRFDRDSWVYSEVKDEQEQLLQDTVPTVSSPSIQVGREEQGSEETTVLPVENWVYDSSP